MPKRKIEPGTTTYRGIYIRNNRRIECGRTFYSLDSKGNLQRWKLLDIVTSRSIIDNEVYGEGRLYAKLLDGSDWSQMLYADHCFATAGEANPNPIVTNAVGKPIKIGSIVWLWRKNSTSQWDLVWKKVTSIMNRERVYCTYEDVLWPRPERADRLYTTAAGARAAYPDRAKSLDSARFRAGVRSKTRTPLYVK